MACHTCAPCQLHIYAKDYISTYVVCCSNPLRLRQLHMVVPVYCFPVHYFAFAMFLTLTYHLSLFTFCLHALSPPYFPTHSLILLSLHYFIFLHFSTFFPVLCDGDFRDTSMIYIFLPLFFFLNYPRITTYKCQRTKTISL